MQSNKRPETYATLTLNSLVELYAHEEATIFRSSSLSKFFGVPIEEITIGQMKAPVAVFLNKVSRRC